MTAPTVRQVMPSFDVLVNNYPDGPPESVKKLIGGDVDDPSILDTCAIRMSRAMNYSGVHIPFHHHGLYTVAGRDKLRYALRMQELKNWIQYRFGSPRITAVKPCDRDSFAGFKGIIAFDIHFGLNP